MAIGGERHAGDNSVKREKLVKRARLFLVLAALAGLPGLTSAQTAGPATAPSVPEAANPAPLPSAKQAIIRDFVKAQKIEPVTVTDKLVAGSVVPPAIELRGLPSDMVTEVPEVTSYLFVVVPDGIAIVERGSRKVVQLIGR